MTSIPISYQFSSDAVGMTIYMDGALVESVLFEKGFVEGHGAEARQWSFDGARRVDGQRWGVKLFKFIEITAGRSCWVLTFVH